MNRRHFFVMKRFSLQTTAAGSSVLKYDQYVAVKLQPCVFRPMSATLTETQNQAFVPVTGKKDVPPSAVTRPICGIMGTIRLVAGM